MNSIPTSKNRRLFGFSLIELVIVVVIIAIIAAIAIPKMSRAATGAGDAALAQDLAQMRSAIDMFTAEHGGTAPSAVLATFQSQMIGYTDVTGATGTKDTTHIYGPYMKAFPPLPVGSLKGNSSVTATGPAGTGAFAWYWDGANIVANLGSSEADTSANQKAYNTY